MFKSDNISGVHPDVMEALIKANVTHAIPYGDDEITKEAISKFRRLFKKEDIEVAFVGTGTAANVIGIGSLIRRHEAVICVNTAHLNTDECGAFERFTGSKILSVPHENGKLTIEAIKENLVFRGDVHEVKPRVITISQPTEMGTVYSIEEIKMLARYAHENNMLLHMDGARIANAVVSLGLTFKEMITDTGVDLLSFGGTKNGMMFGEAIVAFKENMIDGLMYNRKQGMHMVSKMRFISAQFLAYLDEGVWKSNASHSNDMSRLLYKELQNLKSVEIVSYGKTNMIFLTIPREWNDTLLEQYPFYVLDESRNLIRLVTSFDTLQDEVLNFVGIMKELDK